MQIWTEPIWNALALKLRRIVSRRVDLDLNLSFVWQVLSAVISAL